MEPEKPTSPKPGFKERFVRLMAEYGVLALIVHYVIFGACLVGFAAAIEMGVDVGSAAGTAGTWAAAYVATQVIKPLRLFAVLGLTPLIAALIQRFRKKPEGGTEAAPAVTTSAVQSEAARDPAPADKH